MPDLLVCRDADEVLIVAREYLERLGFAAPIPARQQPGVAPIGRRPSRNLAHDAGADLSAVAAALGNGIALTHPFPDGNKWAAFAGTTAFPEINGRPPPAAFWQLAEQLIAQHEQSNRADADALLAHLLHRWK